MKTARPKQFYLLITGLFLTAFLVGCNMPGSGDEADKGLMATLARQTVSVRLTQAFLETQIASGQVPAATDTTIPEGSVTPENTATQQYTNTPGPTPTNTPIPCNWAQFVEDVTIPDNTEIVAGAVFTKTWRLKNIGTCDWTSGYRLIFNGGDQMNAPSDSQFTSGTVSSGATVDVSVDLVAPGTAGTYQGNFLLRSSDNIVFGLGARADSNFWVKIIVIMPTATPTATATATVTSTATLTQTPTPTTATSDFTLSYENVHDCGGSPYATTRVDNVGGTTFESVQIQIEDVTASSVLYSAAINNTPYMSGTNDCPPAASSIAPGGTAYIAANIAGYTSGNTARETLMMCTQDNLGGDCITKTVDFVLP